MATGEFDLVTERFRNEVRKEFHRRLAEYIAFGIIVAIAIGCGVAIATSTATTQSPDGKTTTVSGPDESTKSWAKTILITVVGAAIGYSMKQNPKPTPQ